MNQVFEQEEIKVDIDHNETEILSEGAAAEVNIEHKSYNAEPEEAKQLDHLSNVECIGMIEEEE